MFWFSKKLIEFPTLKISLFSLNTYCTGLDSDEESEDLAMKAVLDMLQTGT